MKHEPSFLCIWIPNFERSNFCLSTNIMHLSLKFSGGWCFVCEQLPEISNAVWQTDLFQTVIRKSIYGGVRLCITKPVYWGSATIARPRLLASYRESNPPNIDWTPMTQAVSSGWIILKQPTYAKINNFVTVGNHCFVVATTHWYTAIQQLHVCMNKSCWNSRFEYIYMLNVSCLYRRCAHRIARVFSHENIENLDNLPIISVGTWVFRLTFGSHYTADVYTKSHSLHFDQIIWQYNS